MTRGFCNDVGDDESEDPDRLVTTSPGSPR